MSAILTKISASKSFGGDQYIYSHYSDELKCVMKFAIFLPKTAGNDNKVPVLYFLSGLTCTEENFIQKAGVQRYASQLGICIVCPDTSPRNVNIPGEDDAYDFGSGAGFYVNATETPWNKNYRMYSYVTGELINIINDNFPVVKNKQSICGHSMGGHGALICALKNPGLYKSVSALAPIANPINSPWGQKALLGYLGPDKETWKQYDATELIKTYNGDPIEIFIDQGSEDNFYKQKQLLPENLMKAASNNNLVKSILKIRELYDHSYYYVASFIGEHIEYHADILNG